MMSAMSEVSGGTHGAKPKAGDGAKARETTTAQDWAARLPIRFRPAEPSFVEGQLFRQGDSERISHVTLVCGASDRVAVADLERVFGGGRYEQSMQLQAPSERVYRTAEPNATWQCTLFASVENADDASTRTINVRRDPRMLRS